MEFRDYWRLLWRRRYVVAPLMVVTFVASALFSVLAPPLYKTETTVHVLAVMPPRVPGSPEYYSTEYYRTVYSEYITDDLGVIVKSESFAQKIAERIRSQFGQDVDVKEIQDSITTTKKLHRTLKITIATGSETMTRKIGQATDDVLRTEAAGFFSRSDPQPVQINVVDPPRKPSTPGLLRRLLDVLLHTGVAGVVGVALALLLHYLDDRILDETDAARTLGWRVMGAVPADGARAAESAGVPVPALAAWAAWSGLVARRLRKTAAGG